MHRCEICGKTVRSRSSLAMHKMYAHQSNQQTKKEIFEFENTEEVKPEPSKVEREKEEFEFQCKKCGHQFNGMIKYCQKCGIELEWEEED